MRLAVPLVVEDDRVARMNRDRVRKVGDERLVCLAVVSVDIDGEGLGAFLAAAPSDEGKRGRTDK